MTHSNLYFLATVGSLAQGTRIAIVGALLSLVLFLVDFLGRRYGQMPTEIGAAQGRVLVARIGRWVFLAMAVVGVVEMLINL